MENEELLTEGTNSEQQEENLEQIEEVEVEDLSEFDEEPQEPQKVAPQEEEPKVNRDTAPKLLKERKELKNENATLKQRLSELEFRAEIGDLKSKYGDVDVDQLKEFKAQPQYTSLPLEDVYLLYRAKQPKEDKPSNLGVVGTKGQPIVRYITQEKLDTLSQAEYNKARQLMIDGKLILK